jgi:hypothetical protein
MTNDGAERLRSAWVKTHLNLIFNLVLFVAFAAWTFDRAAPKLMLGLDGNYVHDFVDLYCTWWDFSFSFTRDFIRTEGSLPYTLNIWLVPSYFTTLLFKQLLDVRLVFVVVAVELFVATYFCGRMLRFDRVASLLAAWIVPVAGLPFFQQPLLYSYFILVPHLGDLLALTTIICASALTLPLVGWPQNLLVAFGIAAMTILAFFMNPVGVIIFGPAIFAFGIGGVVLANLSGRTWQYLGFVVLIAAIVVASGAITFSIGLSIFSAPRFFTDEMTTFQIGKEYISSIFLTGFGKVFVLGGLLGAIYQRWRSSSKIVLVAAWVHVVLVTLVLGGGFLVVNLPRWSLPSPIYLETALWPFHALFASALFIKIVDVVSVRTKVGAFAHLLPALLIAAFVGCSLISSRDDVEPDIWRTPMKQNAITTKLEQDISIRPGSAFRGRVANFLGVSSARGKDWLQYHVVDSKILTSIGNDMRMVGPWHDQIPTFQEYSPTMSAQSYLMNSRILTNGDRQIRNIVVITKVDVDFLAAHGIRYVLTEAPVAGAQQVLSLNPGLPEVPEILLSEIGSPNLGNYFPDKVTVVNNIGDAIERLKNPIDLRHEIILFEPMTAELTSAATSRFYLERNGDIHVVAESRGTSLLLLPFEFSNCEKIESISSTARLVRANVSQTAVLFTGAADLRISYRFGPLDGMWCRVRDSLEFDRLGGRQAGSRFPIQAGYAN